MRGYNFAKAELETDVFLREEAHKLFNLFLQSGKTEFLKSEVTSDFPILIAQGELKEWSAEHLKLDGGDFFFCYWFEHLKEKFPVDVNTGFNAVAVFIECIQKDIRAKNIQSGQYALLRRLKYWLLVTLNIDFAHDFYDEALLLKQEEGNRSVFEFTDAFSKALPFLEIPADKLLLILIHLSKETYSENTLNGINGNLRVGLKELIKSKPEYGKTFLTLCDSVPETTDYTSIVLSALIETSGGDYLDQIKQNYLNDKEIILINAFSLLRNIPDDTVKSILELLLEFNTTNSATVESISNVYFSITEYAQVTDSELKTKAFQKMVLLAGLSKEIKAHTLFQLDHVRGFEEEKRLFILSAFSDPDIKIEWIQNMHRLDEITTPEFLQKLMEVVVIRTKLLFNVHVLENLIDKLAHERSEAFSNSLIQLMIHDNGFVRFAGSRTYNHLTFGRRSFSFICDILLLSEIDQLKLIIATLVEVNPPQDCLANILKLLDSQYETVVSFLLLKLKKMVEAFFDGVHSEMQANFERHIFKNEKAIGVIKDFHDEFVKHLDQKEALNEFNPLFNEYSFIKYYHELHRRKQNKVIGNISDKNSFLFNAPTIHLTKGGGFKRDDQDSLHPLNTFSSSAPFPRVYFIAPERMDREIANKYLVNWEQLFQWEQIQL